jgi:hypothetical protein
MASRAPNRLRGRVSTTGSVDPATPPQPEHVSGGGDVPAHTLGTVTSPPQREQVATATSF